MTAEAIATALGGRKAGNGWMARCVAHQDRKPSMHISEGQNGKLLVHCFAGCSQDQLFEGLRLEGLCREKSRPRPARPAQPSTSRNRKDPIDADRTKFALEI
jgi:putative DNA primase/helicase